MRLSRYSAGRIGDKEDVIAVGQALDHWHRKANIRPQRCDDELLSPRLLHGLDDALVFPRVDESPIDRLLSGKDVLDAAEEVPTSFLGDGSQYRRDFECLRRLGESSQTQ